MATLKIKWLSAASVFTILLGAFFMVKAMDKEPIKKVTTSKKLVTQTWKFIGEEDDDPLNASFYELDAADDPCPGLPETVCKIEAPADQSNPNLPDMNA
ncbi:hypothetical protein [Sphingobacterium corticibacterium]|uniref:Uncharacterized protein n=1 Tax=Sphingobacterium corticibacterium TaxID=2484746 RepID=A0A4Q6XV30_9SPHI|nr:hypothetical protein [Sphingobacterium corticibacterium]RZF60246.1 hypothetical protein EWE74_14155 [Sphingobacterium corticibacterium]